MEMVSRILASRFVASDAFYRANCFSFHSGCGGGELAKAQMTPTIKRRIANSNFAKNHGVESPSERRALQFQRLIACVAFDH
jgi:hypothetical protein